MQTIEKAPRLTGGDLCRITVRGRDGSSEVFEVRRNDLLLKAAIEQGVDYPHNCRVGVCGTCKTRVVEGRVSPMVDLALSPLKNDEIEAGYVLACQAKVRTDLVVEAKLGRHALLPVTTVSSHVSRWTKLPGDVIDLRLKLDEPVQFNAGQYCTIAESGSFTRRSYSYYDVPPAGEGAAATEVGFLVKRLPGGRFSEWLFEKDRSGTRFWIEGPYGLMGIDDVHVDGLCVAGGTGLAPILSIVGDRLRKSPTARFTIVFGVRTQKDVFANERLQQLLAEGGERVRLVTILSHEPEGSTWAGPRGLVTAVLTPALGVDFRKVAAFICGNLGMVEAVERNLIALGVDADRIHADKFVPSGTP
ncbi:ferredoxin-NADP reductase [Panacagrimonas perspica]|uniref:Ferredoxin-NADP reductase n=1 Tax=Panacagrimonas perspica TaxID=381431 RepID=A0A4R7NTC5_9GAMM|nr:2Fe-2S iron-sulfur cluster binding domain-containing protein [Panacagrimonas perspica]TDU24207.1 ferredoxin-NADP reductase [Panacagrimonas perspica]